jgi:hypothetical protein
MRIRRLLCGCAVAGATVVAIAGPAAAHDCFNPNKPAGAGVNYTITGFDSTTGEPTFEQTGPGQGIGGFVTIAPGVFGDTAVEVHTIGNSSSHETVGGPGSMTPAHACDGKGIDYIDACFGG